MESFNPLKEKSTTQKVIDSVKSLNPMQEENTSANLMESVNIEFHFYTQSLYN